MKETLIDLKERRSCRKYLPQQIKEEELNAILEAGTYAPTGMGAQSPVIVVVQMCIRDSYMTAQQNAIKQYGVFQTLKQQWVNAVNRNPDMKKDVFLAMIINFVPKEVTLEQLSKDWDILKKYSDTMKNAEK